MQGYEGSKFQWIGQMHCLILQVMIVDKMKKTEMLSESLLGIVSGWASRTKRLPYLNVHDLSLKV